MRWRTFSSALAFGGTLLAGLAFAAPISELREALARKPNIEHGSSLYEVCSSCHQPDGAGAAGSDVPSIAGQHSGVIIKQLVDFRDTKRIDLRMNAFASSHRLNGPQDLADVAAYIATLPPQQTDEVGNGLYTGAGAQAYKRACESCHGSVAEGNDQLRHPRLAGQHYRYLVRQIELMIDGSRRNMTWDHARLLESLTDEEITGLADHLARQKPAPD